jgi:hypothetical protein
LPPALGPVIIIVLAESFTLQLSATTPDFPIFSRSKGWYASIILTLRLLNTGSEQLNFIANRALARIYSISPAILQFDLKASENLFIS